MQENESKKNATTPTKRGGRPKKNSGLGDTIEQSPPQPESKLR
jgi:ADP-dependent phosphofructokinase/glucokinase